MASMGTPTGQVLTGAQSEKEMIDLNETKLEFRGKATSAFKQCLEILTEVDQKKFSYCLHNDWPLLSYSDVGFPDISPGFDSVKPVDFSSILRAIAKSSRHRVNCFDDLFAFIENNKSLAERILPHYQPGRSLNWYMFLGIFFQIVDRYVHKYKTKKFAQNLFEEVYMPLENSIYSDKIEFDIVVPLLFLHFDFDEYRINDESYLKKMDDSFHLARASQLEFFSSPPLPVMSSATHALVLSNWECENPGLARMNSLVRNENLPIDVIEKWFGLLRIAVDAKVGYAQVLIVPKGWVYQYMADLPPLIGTSTRSYPPEFDNYYWLFEGTKVQEKELDALSKLMRIWDSDSTRPLEIALRRLNRCALRESSEDIVLDSTIGLEVLFGDKSKTEINYKMSLRAAALSRLSNLITKLPKEVFYDMKKIYDYRSAVVHGSKKADKKRRIVLDKKNEVQDAAELSIHYLRAFLKVMIENKEYQDVKNIDEKLLLEPIG